ncbi:hypothetical protein [Paenibacillus oceani]|uniref:Uncharacterized protein n=1 Tax=Paenibacillus oceani TaxID=2772510 RepID=A0A927CAQ2_9BACL|nr:hypothetical protein [Paenibacillus oceani]MBD2862556.1 hypothetical protein [Paenibacillus oceani]
MQEHLIRHLSRSAQRFAVMEGVHGGQIVIVERGGRVWALTPATRIESAFWTNPAALEQDAWNIGGDRTWISPELDYFNDRANRYRVPPELDPGDWSMTANAGEPFVKLEQDCTLHHRPSGKEIRIHLEKQLMTIPNPLLTNTSTAYVELAGIGYIGYEVRQRMTVSPLLPGEGCQPTPSQTAAGYCGLWSIMQVPAGGTAIVPTWGSTKPLVMFGNDRQIEVDAHPSGICLPYRGSHLYKLSFDALQSTGRFGYIRRLNERESNLVVRQFSVYPADLYADYPPGDTNCRGLCTQFFYDGGQLGGFGELEYHTPAVPIGTHSFTSDRSQLYYFTGETGRIHALASLMLGIRVSVT